ncbi:MULTISPECIES: amino acid ABC transporter permease [Cysteiniphilum]|uniref:amino acid ABC transporter permease n=1 Tax=Cysteiniphilum TaxID=2056696 RepID=UPI001939FEB2|nr:MULTISPECIES: amino acid ABC transporter permease [Cysteiniphilum]
MNNWLGFLSDLMQQLSLVVDGLYYTLLLSFIITITGFIMGLIIFYLSIHKHRITHTFAQAYISFFIGTPLVVLLFIMYYGLPQWHIHLNPFTVAIIGFTLNVGAYNAAYLKTAYRGLDYQQIYAAKAQGFTELNIFWLIILPQVLRNSQPALISQIISNLKDTSVAFLIQFTGFFAQVQELASYDFHFFQAYLFAAVIYLVLVSFIIFAIKIASTCYDMASRT